MKTRISKTMLRQIILAALFAAMTTVLTFFVKIPTHNGYMHLGDSMIYLGACFLPTPIALLSAGIGGMLADYFGGYAMYMLPTFIIKSMLVFAFDSKSPKILTKRNGLATAIGGVITIIGYYLTEVILISISSSSSFAMFTDYFFSKISWTSALYSIPGNTLQAVGSAVVFIALSAALDKTNIKSRLR